MISIYYIGGPWDLHKVAEPDMPRGDTRRVAEAKPIYMIQDASVEAAHDVKTHTYRLRQVADKLFVALHEGFVR